MNRTVYWQRNGKLLEVNVDGRGRVFLTYEVLVDLLMQAGFEQRPERTPADGD